jgi:hypothetical protein
MPGNVCATPPFPSVINAYTRRTNRSCFRANPATFSSVRRGAFLNSAFFSAVHSRRLKSGALTGYLSPKSCTSFTSHTEIRWRRPSPTGLRKRTDFVTEWRPRQQEAVPDRAERPANGLRLGWESERESDARSSHRSNFYLSMTNLHQKTSPSPASSSMTTRVTGFFPWTETITRVSSAITFLFCSGANTSSDNFT